MPDGFGLLTTERATVETAWGHRPAALRVPPPLLDALNAVTIERLLEEESLRPPHITFARNGSQIPDRDVTVEDKEAAPSDAGQLDRAKARALLADGATAVVYRANRLIDSLGAVTAGVSSALRASCDATVFHTPAHSPGLGWHRDAQHVIAVQITGSKQWRVEQEAPSRWWAVGSLPSDGPGTDVAEVTLRRGDALYMPPGVAHTARATDESSTHVSFVILEPQTQDFALALFERAFHRVGVRLEQGPLTQRLARATAVVDELAAAIDELDIGDLLRTVEEDTMDSGQPPPRTSQ
ncbi:hypothetical protein GCM10027091_23280 [Streptomyces daliensis]